MKVGVEEVLAIGCTAIPADGETVRLKFGQTALGFVSNGILLPALAVILVISAVKV